MIRVTVVLLAALGRAALAADGDAVGPLPAYRGIAGGLARLIEHEMKDKGLPAFSIALVDGEETVWAAGFGLADPEASIPATARTLHRVGSVSKLFTDIALLRLVERGELDLDAPLERVLSDFRPRNPFGKPLTARQLLAHHAGLVREPPVGHYFDPTEPSLKDTVLSLNRTELVHAPGARAKYSNAGIAVAGYVLERLRGKPFEEAVAEEVLRPLGLADASFAPGPALRARAARALMWTAHGRTFPAPTFRLGTSAAGELYASVLDLARFLRALAAGGRGPGGQVLKPETLEAMWKPQFAREGETGGIGLGFFVDRLEGERRVGHGGAIYGFSTALSWLTERKLGVAAVATRDVANPVVERIAEHAVRALLALKKGEKPPGPVLAARPDPARARALLGHYAGEGIAAEIIEHAGDFFILRGGIPAPLRALGDGLVADGPQGRGPRVEPRPGGGIALDGKLLERVPAARPEPPPERWRGLIGEYGWDHNTLYILERGGRLVALIEWLFAYELEEVSGDVFRFPDRGLYPWERLIFTRGADGAAHEVEAASVVWKRREGPAARIRPQRPLEEIRREALAARPPREEGELAEPDLVDLAALDPTIRLDIRYAGRDNFLGEPVYTQARAFLQRPVAEALLRAHRSLREQGYGLLIHDGYRPWFVTKVFWEAAPPGARGFVADPARGSRHNRGAAVDLTLYHLKTGEPARMPGAYDEFSDRSYPLYPGGSSLERWQRGLLRGAMEAEGFTVYPLEWWHFDFKGWEKFPILNVPFEAVTGAGRGR